jgi:type I restriction enzyme M protein
MKRPEEGGSRVAIVFNGSPLFTGAAGSGESEIRRWIIENDWLEAVVALPDQLFYNTGISTYFWVVTNRKSEERRVKVQLVDARELFVKMRKSLGEKRKEISSGQIDEITRLYGDFTDGEKVKILPNEAFGFLRITVERPLRLRWEIGESTILRTLAAKPIQKLPQDAQQALNNLLSQKAPAQFGSERELIKTMGPELSSIGLAGPAQKAVWSALAVRDEQAPVITDRNGSPDPDPELRDNENVALPALQATFEEDPTQRFFTLEYRSAVDDYMRDEVAPYVPDAWVDHERTKIGYEIPLTRHFYRYVPPRPLKDIDAEIKALEDEIQRLLGEVAR